MFQFTVALLSGRSVSLSLPESSNVGDLKALAQKSLGRRFLRLATSDGRFLTDLTEALPAGLQDGDQLTAITGQARLEANACAFALWCSGGQGVVTWGNPRYGGDSSAVQNQLRSVQQVQATKQAFAAILEDGSVVTWGDPDRGGDSSEVQDKLKSVRQVQATHWAFAAILEDGSIVTWSDPNCGGDSSAVQGQLKNVQQIQGTDAAFAAILEDGSVVTWGHPEYGGDSSAVQGQLKSVQQIQGTDTAFAAILEDGSVVTWGHPDCGGDSSAVQDQLSNLWIVTALWPLLVTYRHFAAFSISWIKRSGHDVKTAGLN